MHQGDSCLPVTHYRGDEQGEAQVIQMMLGVLDFQHFVRC